MHIDLLLGQIAALLLVSRLLTPAMRRLGQPRVIAEILAGIALGPTLLGAVAPSVMNTLFPADSMPVLGTVAQLGLVFYMFLIGLEFDPRLLDGRLRAALGISSAGIVVPLLLGIATALLLPADMAGHGTPTLAFSLFVGVAMSVTAFPVLARILAERRLVHTPVGAMALAAAAVDDVGAWTMLAFVVGIASSAGPSGAVLTVGLTALYGGLVWFVLRPFLARVGPRRGQGITVDLITTVVLLVVLSALATEKIGVHALFGGFLIGAAMPRQNGLTHALTEKIEDFVTIVLLPLFFAWSGLRTEIGLLTRWEDLGWTLALLGVATAGKFGGAALAARWAGFDRRESTAIGVLMNTRGLMELVVLNVGLDLGVISERMFAMMVLVALVTTWATGPLLRLLAVHPPAPAVAGARRGVMIGVSDPTTAESLVRLATHLAGSEPVWVAHLRPVDRPHEVLRPHPDLTEPLAAALQAAREVGLHAEPITWPSASPGDDLAALADRTRSRVVLLGAHRGALSGESFGGVVGDVLRGTEAIVGVLHDHAHTATRTLHVDLAGSHAPALRQFAAALQHAGLASADQPEGADLIVCGIDRMGSSDLEHHSVLWVRSGRDDAPLSVGTPAHA